MDVQYNKCIGAYGEAAGLSDDKMSLDEELLSSREDEQEAEQEAEQIESSIPFSTWPSANHFSSLCDLWNWACFPIENESILPIKKWLALTANISYERGQMT